MGALITGLLMLLLHLVVPALDLQSESHQTAVPEQDEAVVSEPPETHIFAIDPDVLARSTGTIRAHGQNMFAGADFVLNQWEFTRIEIDDSVLRNSVVEVDIDLASISSWAFWRLPYIRSAEFLNVAQYPVARVKLFNIDMEEINIYGIGSYSGQLELSVKGHVKYYQIQFEVTERYPIKIHGELIVKRSELGLGKKPHWLNIFAIRDEIIVRFNGTIPNYPKQEGFPIFGDSRGRE